jgi:hypothetical protein
VSLARIAELAAAKALPIIHVQKTAVCNNSMQTRGTPQFVLTSTANKWATSTPRMQVSATKAGKNARPGCVGAKASDECIGKFCNAGVDRVWVDHESFLAKVWGKTGSKLYSKTSAADYVDNLQVTPRPECEDKMAEARMHEMLGCVKIP